MAQLQTDNDESCSLPAILCLHGYGTNADILRYQLRQITQALRNSFRFVFVDGPFHVQNRGPGVPLTFADARPFRRWHSDKTLAGIFGVSANTLKDERRQVRELLRDTLESEKRRADGSGIVGVMAFSQGAGLAAALCLDAELGRDIRFAIIICALYPAVSLAEDEGTSSKSGSDSPPLTPPLIDIPSIHVQGTSDTWKGQGTKVLEEYFVGERVKRIELKIGHEVPSKPKEAASIAEEVIAVWNLSQVQEERLNRSESYIR